MGINDIAGSRTSAQIVTDIATIISNFPSQRCWVGTVTPRATSTDSFVTVANQTIDANNSQRVALNNVIRRLGISWMYGYFEIADAVESARDSGKWAVSPSGAAYTSDGVHESSLGNIAIANAKAITPEKFYGAYYGGG